MIPKFRSEKECLKRVFAILGRASDRWLKVKFTAIERQPLDAFRVGQKVRGLFAA